MHIKGKPKLSGIISQCMKNECKETQGFWQRITKKKQSRRMNCNMQSFTDSKCWIGTYGAET